MYVFLMLCEIVKLVSLHITLQSHSTCMYVPECMTFEAIFVVLYDIHSYAHIWRVFCIFRQYTSLLSVHWHN